MLKILVVGNAPLPEENTKSRPAAGLRTHQFIKGLENWAKAELLSVKIAMPECYEPGTKYPENVIAKDDPALSAKLQKIHDGFKPNVILSINTFPSYIVAGLKSEALIWADLNGWIMAEAQAQAYKLGNNDMLNHYKDMEEKVLRRADKISTVSEFQKYAVLGELGAIGRLNRETFGYELVTSIANGTEWFEGEKGDSKMPGIPEKGFKLLWMGGYNTWVDEETLFNGVEAAMKKNPDLYYISTGGKIEGLDGSTFGRFKAKVDKSKFKDRFLFLGWIETSDIPSLYRSVDAGLNVDLMCVETKTGARNRINEMMKFGLPIITTLGSEIADEVEGAGAGLVLKSGDSSGLCSVILEMSKDQKDYGKQGAIYIEKNCNYRALIKDLTNWLENPLPAPDRNIRVSFGIKGKLKMARSYLKQNGFRKFFRKFLQKIV